MTRFDYAFRLSIWSALACSAVAIQWLGGVFLDIGKGIYASLLFFAVFFVNRDGVSRRTAAVLNPNWLDTSLSPLPFLKISIASLLAFGFALVVVPKALEGIWWALPSMTFPNLINDRADYAILLAISCLMVLPMMRRHITTTHEPEATQ
ncbi:MAG: hypothetical protein AAGD04_09725 [Pseudomonadota bacterium]